jgi:oxygen-independent coproporphyrinogen-3 oxidase
MTGKVLGLYVHIPFCRQKCFYCDFPSSAGQEAVFPSYIRALVREITVQGVKYSDCTVDTVFIGGGTPTVLPLTLLLDVCHAIRQSFQLAKDYEWTIEANPGTVDGAALTALHQGGVNRLSFGVQSFDDEILKKLGRIHTAQEAVNSVRQAAAAGFANINLDLMTGLPGQNIENFTATIEQAVKLPIRHLSVYSLKVEEGTVFAASQQAGKLILPDEAIEAAIDELVVSFLPAHRLPRYEISNYAQAGYTCRHNLKYWRYQSYLGLGAAAHSFFGGPRQANIRDVAAYIEAIRTDQSAVAVVESLPEDVQRGEMIFLALRTTAGLLFTDYNERFHSDFVVDYENVLTELSKQSLIEWNKQEIRLTDIGMKFGNIVFCAFLP